MPDSAVFAAARAYDSTKEQILSGELAGGSLLSEVVVAEQLGVSRTPVHEAFLRLAAEDLLQLLPRRGALVVPVPSGESVDVLEVRVALETAAVRRLVSSGADLDELLELLTESVDQQVHVSTSGELARFAEIDAQFHRAIVSASGNRVADRFYESLHDRQRRMTVSAVGRQPHRLAVLAEEHRGLARHIEGRDPAAFEAALVVHLEATHDLLLGR